MIEYGKRHKWKLLLGLGLAALLAVPISKRQACVGEPVVVPGSCKPAVITKTFKSIPMYPNISGVCEPLQQAHPEGQHMDVTTTIHITFQTRDSGTDISDFYIKLRENPRFSVMRSSNCTHLQIYTSTDRPEDESSSIGISIHDPWFGPTTVDIIEYTGVIPE